MAAVDVSHTSFNSVENAGNANESLLTTMQLVDVPRRSPVPHHLLETQIYSKTVRNEVVQAMPVAIHFSGFKLSQRLNQKLRLVNISTEVQRMHIIPPQTSYFKIHYTKGERLVPGLALECTIEFVPDEWRYFYDCIRVHCNDEDNLIIPIHAYPVMNTDDFPQQITFNSVPIGHKRSKRLPLKCHAPLDFEFNIKIVQPHAAFTVDPLEGIVPGNGSVDVVVTFAPTEFNTATMTIQLNISQFNTKPLMCRLVGTSTPGLAKAISEKSYLTETKKTNELLDPISISPLDRARQRKKKTNFKNDPSLTKQQTEITREGIKFPANLNTPHAVATVLNQEPGKLRMKDLREVLSANKGRPGSTRQVKEAAFEQAVRKNIYDERQNQLRWQLKLGDNPIEPSEKVEILQERNNAWSTYKLQRGDCEPKKEYQRKASTCIMRRTIRDHKDVPENVAQFDSYTNNLWAMKHTALNRFRQAARLVIVRLRADKKIKELRETLLNPNKKRPISGNLFGVDRDKDHDEAENLESFTNNLQLDVSKVKTITFASYNPPNLKDDMPYDYCFTNFPDPEENLLAVDALGEVPYKQTDVVVKEKVDFFKLKVPQQYRLCGYQPHDVHHSSISYVPARLSRPLRTGAENEIVDIPVKELEVRENVCDDEEPQPVTLRPPQALYEPVTYPAMHIFNPSPGLQVFQAPLPYAETDPDFHLCPLPRTKNDNRKRIGLDEKDTIRGMMQWKKFPSQGLTSLANTPTLTSVWVPRWDDPFDDELLPSDAPQLFDGLSAEDALDVQDDAYTFFREDNTEEETVEGSSTVLLTPEMVNAQFSLIDMEANTPSDDGRTARVEMFPFGNKMPPSNIPVSHVGPVPREKREKELEYFMKKKYNQLGQKVQKRVFAYNKFKTRPELFLR